MNRTSYPLYKGLQQPLTYRGFKGRFIAWGIASLVTGLLVGGIAGSLTSMYFGSFLTLGVTTTGLLLTRKKQENGLYSKTRNKEILIHSTNLKIRYDYDPKK
jgi:hypothetical protein